jgi:hypothetical protein
LRQRSEPSLHDRNASFFHAEKSRTLGDKMRVSSVAYIANISQRIINLGLTAAATFLLSAPPDTQSAWINLNAGVKFRRWSSVLP